MRESQSWKKTQKNTIQLRTKPQNRLISCTFVIIVGTEYDVYFFTQFGISSGSC